MPIGPIIDRIGWDLLPATTGAGPGLPSVTNAQRADDGTNPADTVRGDRPDAGFALDPSPATHDPIEPKGDPGEGDQ
jgi:hypothetical protein